MLSHTFTFLSYLFLLLLLCGCVCMMTSLNKVCIQVVKRSANHCHTKFLLKHKTIDQIYTLSATRPIPPPHAGGEVLSAQILQIRKCQTTEGCDAAEISWLCATPLSQTFACCVRRALTPAHHLKSLFLRPDSRSLSNTCKYIEDEDVTYIRWLCSSCPKEILPIGKYSKLTV